MLLLLILTMILASCGSSPATLPARSHTSGSGKAISPTAGDTARSTTTTIGALGAAAPSQPGPMAILPSGRLLVTDPALNEIFMQLQNGSFEVIAGNGIGSFSGDGGPAQKASLHSPEGLAVGQHGTIYVADSGNLRIRAISTSGVIRTIAGNGEEPASHNAIAIGANATATAIGHPIAVTTGPKGSVYFAAAHSVFKLTSNGKLQVEVGPNTLDSFTSTFPVVQACMPISLAVSSNDNLYINCSDPYAMVEMTANGLFHYLGPVRPHDAFATLVRSQSGGVMAVNGAAIEHFDSAGHEVVSNFISFRLPSGELFWPQGIAEGIHGSLYLDQDGIAGIGPPAILKRTLLGAVDVLWSNAGHSLG